MKLAAARVDSDTHPYASHVHVGHHELIADEPPVLGGADAGPPPYGLLLAALGACTSITLRMYASRHGWEIGPIHVALSIAREDDVERIERIVRLSPTVPPEQRARLAEIAEKTPVTKTLTRGTAITTTFEETT